MKRPTFRYGTERITYVSDDCAHEQPAALQYCTIRPSPRSSFILEASCGHHARNKRQGVPYTVIVASDGLHSSRHQDVLLLQSDDTVVVVSNAIDSLSFVSSVSLTCDRGWIPERSVLCDNLQIKTSQIDETVSTHVLTTVFTAGSTVVPQERSPLDDNPPYGSN